MGTASHMGPQPALLILPLLTLTSTSEVPGAANSGAFWGFWLTN